MSPDQLAALRQFFATSEHWLPDVVAVMYERFFEAMPETARLFKGDMDEQRRQFTAMLWGVVRLTRSSELWPVNAWTGEAQIPAIEKLGRLHARAGVQPEHFETMKIVLSRCFRDKFPRDYSPGVDEALAFIFDVISRAALGPGGNSHRSRMTRKALASANSSNGAHGFSGDKQTLASYSDLRQQPPGRKDKGGP